MTEYNHERRSEAAKRGWEKRRQNKSLPDYGTQGHVDKIPPIGEIDLGSELPETRDLLAGGIAEWPDPVYDIDPEGHMLMRACPAVVNPVNKLASRTASLDLVSIGDSDLSMAIQEIIDQAKGTPEMIYWMTWARLEGLRFNQIKRAASREGSRIWVVPNFVGGGRMKQKAGGTLQWDGRRLMQIQQTSGTSNRQPGELPKEKFLIFRPGAGSNPEGDLDFGLAAYRIAYNWNEALKNMDAYTELFGIPTRLIKKKLDKARPTQVNSLLTTGVQKLQQMQNNKAVALSDQDIIELLEPKNKGLEQLIAYAKYLEGVVHQLLLLNTLTSDTTEAGPTGSSQVHLSEEDKAVFYHAHLIAEMLNEQLLPWIFAANPDLPKLKEGESSPYLAFQPHGQRDDGTNTVEDEAEMTQEVEEIAQPNVQMAEESATTESSPEVVEPYRDSTPEEVIIHDNPYSLIKRGDMWCVTKTVTGEVVPGGCHDSETEARAHHAALESNVND